MGPRRWILSSSPINGSGCIHDCYVSNLPPHHPTSSGHRFYPNGFIAAVSATAAVFFLVLTYYTILVRRRRADHHHSGHHPPSETEGADTEYQAAWRSLTVGLNESTINSISVKPYISERGITTDCSVCLGEFRDGELVRLLPVCEHAFHVSCIDTWLRAHVNCPLCRANIIDPADSSEGGLSSITLVEGNALINDRRVSGDLEVDEGRERRTMTDTDSSLDRGESSILAGLSDFPGSGLQPEWRSNSMDSFLETDIVLSLNRGEAFQHDKKEQEQYSDEKKGKQSSSFKEDYLQKSSKEIGGDSTSGSGRMFLFSRYGRARSSSVLPL